MEPVEGSKRTSDGDSAAELSQEGYSTDQFSNDGSTSKHSRTNSLDRPSLPQYLSDEIRTQMRLTAISEKQKQFTYTPFRLREANPTNLVRYLGHSDVTNISHIPLAFMKSHRMLWEELQPIFDWAEIMVSVQLTESEHTAEYSYWLQSLYRWQGSVGNHAIKVIDMVMDAWGRQCVPDSYPETTEATESFWWEICVMTVIIETMALYRREDATRPAIEKAQIERMFSDALWKLSLALGKDVIRHRWPMEPPGYDTQPLKGLLLDENLFKETYDYESLWEHAAERMGLDRRDTMYTPGEPVAQSPVVQVSDPDMTDEEAVDEGVADMQ